MDFIAFRRVRIVAVATALGALSFISFDPVPHAARAQEPRGIRSLIYFGVGEALPIVDWMDAVLLNADAADSTNADQLWSGGGLGLNLTGAGVTVGIWDEGPVRSTHRELTARVTVVDAGDLSDHATHVTGTIGATGVDPAARGMAGSVLLRSRNLTNDAAEMALDAGVIDISNHSYGYPRGWTQELLWGGQEVDVWLADYDATAALEDVNFGKYRATNDAVDESLPWGNTFSDARGLDEVLYDNPNLLAVFAAGNDRDNVFQNVKHDGTFVAYFSTSFGAQGVGWHLVEVEDVELYPFPGPDGGATGYDTLLNAQVAKNTLVVGSVLDHTIDPHDPATISASAFSAFGPTDDGRVKPDVVANGERLYSSTETGDAHYEYMSGTSMAAPNAAGTAALLLQHYRNVKQVTDVASATLKGVIIHTATDAGNPGPDYSYGYGLVNAAAAADFISDTEGLNAIVEGAYSGVEVTTPPVSFPGTDLIKVTIVWTDPPPALDALPGGGLDDPTPVLVNDLDLWLTGPGGTYYPWTLDPDNPSLNALQTGPNHVDNVEQVWIENPLPGGYRVHIGGTLDEGYESQDYTFLLSMSPANQWAPSGDGSYNQSANWTNNRAPGGVNALANFVGSITAASTVTVDALVTLGTINFDSGDYSYTIAGTASITLQTSAGDAQINVLAGNHTISAPLTFAAGLTVDTADGTGVTLEPASGYSVLEGNLTKAGSGLLVLGSSLLVVGQLNLNAGEVQAAANVLGLGGGSVNLGDATTLKAAGTINRRVLGDSGSTLELTGTTQIGLSSEADGYAFGGKLVVGSHALGLMDANLAELRGASIAGGSISSLNGIHLLPVVTGDPDSYIKGYGTINGNVVAGTDMPEGTPDLRARIWAFGGKLEITGILSGAWTPIGDVDITGLARARLQRDACPPLCPRRVHGDCV